MGLDMYLFAEVTVFPTVWTDKKDDDGHAISYIDPRAVSIASLFGGGGAVCRNGWMDVKIPVGYWRKANALHAWFIREQAEDDCKPFSVTLEELENLDKICEEVIADPSKGQELLPTRSGFFFGPTDLNDPDTLRWYIEDLERTRSIIANCKKFHDDYKLINEKGMISFIYEASW